jgi:hypothetical protein
MEIDANKLDFLSPELRDNLTRIDNETEMSAESVQDIIKTQNALNDALGELDNRANSLLAKMQDFIGESSSSVTSTTNDAKDSVALANVIQVTSIKETKESARSEERLNQEAEARLAAMIGKPSEEQEAVSLFKKRGGLLASHPSSSDSHKVDDAVASGQLKW